MRDIGKPYIMREPLACISDMGSRSRWHVVEPVVLKCWLKEISCDSVGSLQRARRFVMNKYSASVRRGGWIRFEGT